MIIFYDANDIPIEVGDEIKLPDGRELFIADLFNTDGIDIVLIQDPDSEFPEETFRTDEIIKIF